MNIFIYCVLLVFSLASVNARDRGANRANGSPAPSIQAAAVSETHGIQLDGVLSESAWAASSLIRDFRQREPNDGAPGTFPTEARIVYDGAALYVGVRALDDQPAGIVGLLTRRDSESPSDWIGVMVDSYHDHRSAFEFAVNPAGVKIDRYWYNDGRSTDTGWDAVWEVATHKDGEGWAAEFRIPFSQLRFKPGADQTVGVAVTRTIARLNETLTWPLLSKSASGYVSSFGDLTALELDERPKRLELVPYGVAQVDLSPDEPGNPLARAADADASPGLDLKYAIRPGLTLTGTINPDFGQVEADPAVLNLSAFEVFFSERRPFFVEGSEIFRFDLDCNDGRCSGLFYSRRIGRPPQLPPEEPEGGYSSQPANTTILGAAKLTGRIGGFSIGALNAVTRAEYGQVYDGSSVYSTMAEPPTSYSVLRARKDFSDQSSIGFMATATNRRLSDPVRELPDQAYSGGVDWDWRLGRLYSLTGYWAGSTVHGDPSAISRLQESSTHLFQRPDADHVTYDPMRTQLSGQGLMVGISKIGGERIRFSSSFSSKSPGFDVNDVGFMRRADTRMIGNWLQVRHDRPGRYVRSFRINFNQWTGWNFAGDLLENGGNINAHLVFTNNWSTGVGINANGRTFDDRLTRGGPGGLINGGLSLWQYVNTDDRKPVQVSNSVYWSDDRHGSRRFELSPEVTLRPTSSLLLRFGPSYQLNHDDSQWVEEVSDLQTHYVFGRLQQTTVAMTTRINYTITPTLSLQIYAEPFVSAGRYTGYKELVNGRAERYPDEYTPYAYGGNADFHFTSFRSTNVLRWEFKPGSSLFVVWQQGREQYVEGTGALRFGHDFGGIFRIPGRNTFLVKLAYWLNF